MAIVKITPIPVDQSMYIDRFTDETESIELYSNFIKKHHLKYILDELSDFAPRIPFRCKKGIIEFETDKPCDILRILFGHFIMSEVANIEIVRK